MFDYLRRVAKHAMDVEQAWARLEAVSGPDMMDEAVAAVERYEASGVQRLAAIERVAREVARDGHP